MNYTDIQFAKDTIGRLNARLRVLDAGVSIANKYKRVGMADAYAEAKARADKAKSDFFASLSELESRVLQVMPPKKNPIQSDEKVSDQFKEMTQQELTGSQIRLFAATTPVEIVKRYSNELANDFQAFGRRSGLYWTDTRTGNSFNFGDALTRELKEHDRAREILKQKKFMTPAG